MLIIDKHKDYYDHYSYIYGVDKKVVYDRRGSNKIKDEDLYKLAPPYYKNHNTFYLLLETGFIQRLIEVSSIALVKDSCNVDHFQSFTLEHIHTFSNYEHYYETPISIHSVNVNYTYDWKRVGGKDPWCDRKIILTNNYKETITRGYKNCNNPILAATSLTKIIDGDMIWKEVQTYLSSLNNDVDCNISMSDKEKAETHGFDKYSFRNPIK